MSRNRTLVLRKDTLGDLSPEALQSVVGGTLTAVLRCIPTKELNDLSFEICPTLPIEVCTA